MSTATIGAPLATVPASSVARHRVMRQLAHGGAAGCQPLLHAPPTHVSAHDAETAHLRDADGRLPEPSAEPLIAARRQLSVRQCHCGSPDRPLEMSHAIRFD